MKARARKAEALTAATSARASELPDSEAKWYRVIGDKSSVIAIAALVAIMDPLSTPFNSTSPAGPITAKLGKLILSVSLSTGKIPVCPQVEGGIQYLEDKL